MQNPPRVCANGQPASRSAGVRIAAAAALMYIYIRSASICPLRPARFLSHAKLERRSRALGSAIGHLPTRPGGPARTVPAPVSFWRFRPILGSGAQMEWRGGTDADGAIRRIRPSQAACVRNCDRKRVFGRRHGRWPGARRVASNGGGFARFRRHFAPSWALKTDAKRRLGWVGGCPGPWVHTIAPGER